MAIQKRTAVDRLKNLVRVAEHFKKEPLHLDMDSFIEGTTDYDALSDAEGNFPSRYDSVQQMLEKPDCGTTCCLAGRAGFDPYFNKRGLVTKIDGTFDIPDVVHHSSVDEDLAEFFGITTRDAHTIFYGENETTPRGNISKTKTLNRLIKDIKHIAKERYEVVL